MELRSPNEGLSPVELQRRLAADREGLPFLAYRGEDDELVIRALAGEDPITVGRGEGTDVRLAWDPQVSQLHAELRPLGGEWLVVDDGLSRNGTFVEGERVAGRRRLRDGDLLRCGSTLLLFRQPDAEATRDETAMAGESAPELTAMQRRVLIALCRPLAEGVAFEAPASNKAVADELFISTEAVKFHLRALFDRFEVGDLPQNRKRLALAERALRTGAISPRDLRG